METNHNEESPRYGKTRIKVIPESDIDKLNRFLINLGESKVGYRRKILTLKKFLDIVMGEKED